MNTQHDRPFKRQQRFLFVSESKERFCVSVVDPARPAWFVRHYNYYLHLEPEYNPRNPQIFDDDASFFLIPDKFYPEYFAFESLNYPNHYIRATDDGKLKISNYEGSEEFHNSASFALTDHFVKRTYTNLLLRVVNPLVPELFHDLP